MKKYPLGPRKLSHSVAISAHRHSNKCTIEFLPVCQLGLNCALATAKHKAKTANFIFLPSLTCSLNFKSETEWELLSMRLLK